MAPIEVNNGDSIELFIGLPEVSIPIECPLFSCMGSVWNLNLCAFIYDRRKHYRAELNKIGNNRLLQKFKIDVKVGVTHDENVSLEEKTLTVYKRGCWEYVWQYSFSTLKRKVAQEYRTGNFLKFLFHFHLPSEPSDRRVIKVDCKPQNIPGAGSHLNHLEALSTDYSKMLQDTTFSDVKILCEGKEFKVHKMILGTRSEVFSAMFRSKMIEDKRGVIEVKDIKAAIFHCFLFYLYSGKLPELNFEIAVQLYKVGDKYGVVELMRSCSDYLTKKLSEGNAYEMLVLADQHSDSSFTNDVISYIVERKIPQQDTQWLNLCKFHPYLAIMVQNNYIEKRWKM